MSPWGGLLLIGLGFGGGWWVNGNRLEVKIQALDAQFMQFKTATAQQGAAAQTKNALIALKDLRDKERADDENRRIADSLRADVGRLRDAADRARGSFVPAAPAGAGRPELACFDRAGLESALRDLVAEIRGLVDEGAAAALALDTAKRWAQGH